MSEKKRKRSPTRWQQVYKSEWERELQWVKRSKKDSDAYCNVCRKDLSIVSGGIKDLRRHETTQYHEKNARAVAESSSMSSFVIKEDHNVIDAQLYWANFVCENNLPVSVADSFSKLVPTMFPDSDIAKSFKCCRTKTGQLINQALGKTAQEEIAAVMRQSSFTLLIDESTDKATLRQMVIMARIFGIEKVETHLYKVVAFDGQATGENLFNVVKDAFEEDNIPWANCLSMSSDGARAMVGAFNSVLSRVRKEQTDVWFLHCTCHVAHLAASHACDELPLVCEQLSRDIYTFFKTSGKRQSDFREVQESLEMATHKILRPCFTRWLAMLQCVERLLEQWSALRTYFDTRVEEKEKKTESVKRIISTLHSNHSRLYFLFLQAVLPRFTKFNTMFQHERPFIHKLHGAMSTLLRQFLASYINFGVLQKNDYLKGNLDYRRANQMKDSSIFIGYKTRTLMEEVEFSIEEKEEFFQNVRDFYEVGTKELYRLLPLKDEVLINITVLDPTLRTRGEWEKVEALVARFPKIVKADDMDNLNSEFMSYSLWEIPDYLKTIDDIDIFWGKVAQLPEFPTLGKFAKTLLILPHSNAEVERVFSTLTLIKTAHRTSLSSGMLNALMHCSTRKKIANFVPTDAMRKKAKHLKK